MKLSYVFVAAVLIGAPASGVSAAAQTAQSTTTANDKTIEDRIEKQIARDKSLKDFSIKVASENRVVTLGGIVPTEADRAKGTSGKIEEKTSDAAAKTKEAGSKAIEKTKEGAAKTGEVATDTWITSRIKTKMIGEDVLKDSNVHVSTSDHVVTLTGSVKSAAGREKAA